MDLPIWGHEPVLLEEVLAHLPARPRVVVDCTIGRGGHAAAIAARLPADALLIGLDVDPRNLEYASTRLASAAPRVRLFHANFAELDDVLSAAGTGEADFLLADLGVSTNQLLETGYGLSFSADGPLDMRLDPRLERTAADLVNSLDERELADALYRLADERYSRRIARNIAEERRRSPILSTGRLAEIVRSASPRRGYDPGRRGGAPRKIDPATRTFMALRMLVNREVENLGRLLEIGPKRLACGGTMAVISFHSTEDRLIKQAFRAAEAGGLVSIVNRKPICPADAELDRNPRSRSAKLRLIARK